MAHLGLDFWLAEWNWDPSIVIGAALIVAGYLYAIGPLRKRYGIEAVKGGKIVAFLSGVFIMFLALVSPLDELGDSYLFSAHMVQHLCITIVGPPLLIAGMPAWFLRPITRNHVLFKIARFLVYPAVAFFLYNADFWLWHAPPLYDATLGNQAVHILEHLTFIVFGLLYWWPVFSPSKDLPRLELGGQILYLFLSGMPSVLLGAGLTFTPPLYAPYISAPRAWGISPSVDQQIGGLIMWVPVSIAYIVIMSVLFLRWMLQKEAEQNARERELYAEEEQQHAPSTG